MLEAFWVWKKVKAAKNDEFKLNDEEWSSWEMKDGRTWCMEWRSIYPSSYIDARSLQDHMEVGMAQFGVKSQQKSASGWENSSIGFNTRVCSVFSTSGISRLGKLKFTSENSSLKVKTWVFKSKLEFSSQNSSIQQLSTFQLINSVSHLARHDV